MQCLPLRNGSIEFFKVLAPVSNLDWLEPRNWRLGLEWEPDMPAPFNIIRIDHVVRRATDPTKLERFYLDVLGLRLERREGKLTQLRAGDALIDTG
jgi:Glyoxalase/Bleomycin resistance protein/Dioxygenase superfamily